MIERTIDHETWSQKLQSWDELAVVLEGLGAPNDSLRMLFTDTQNGMDNEMVIVLVENLGFNLGLLQEDCTLVELDLGYEPVQYDNFGVSCESPRCCFVERALMMKAARAFFETGTRGPELSWMDTGASFSLV